MNRTLPTAEELLYRMRQAVEEGDGETVFDCLKTFGDVSLYDMSRRATILHAAVVACQARLVWMQGLQEEWFRKACDATAAQEKALRDCGGAKDCPLDPLPAHRLRFIHDAGIQLSEETVALQRVRATLHSVLQVYVFSRAEEARPRLMEIDERLHKAAVAWQSLAGKFGEMGIAVPAELR